MTKFDLESLLDAIETILQANLNTKIAAVEAEKIAQGFPVTGLAPVDNARGYFLQSWSPENLNIDPAIFYGVDHVEAVGMGPNTVEKFILFVEIILTDEGQDSLANTRINRYTRAIKEVLQENFDQLPSSSQIKIETVRPVSFKLDQNSSEVIKVGGVSLTTSLA